MQVKFFPNQPHCFAFGGFEIQMLRTMEAINCIEPCVGKIDVWEKEDKFNIAHFWGLGINQYDSVTWAKKTKKLVVLTALLSYLDASKDKLENHFSQLCGRAKYEKRIIKNIDALVVVNELQANIAQKYFKCPSDKIHIIPNVVSQKYWMKKNNKFSDLCKLKDYVLTTGNICRRKNQINLALACIKKQYNLVIIGNVLSGEDDYGKELKKIVENNENIFWIR